MLYARRNDYKCGFGPTIMCRISPYLPPATRRSSWGNDTGPTTSVNRPIVREVGEALGDSCSFPSACE